MRELCLTFFNAAKVSEFSSCILLQPVINEETYAVRKECASPEGKHELGDAVILEKFHIYQTNINRTNNPVSFSSEVDRAPTPLLDFVLFLIPCQSIQYQTTSQLEFQILYNEK